MFLEFVSPREQPAISYRGKWGHSSKIHWSPSMLCWIAAWRCHHPPWQSCGWWDLLFFLLLITWCAKPCMSSTLKLARLSMSWLSILAVSKLQVVRKTALFLPQDTLSSCSVRALREHCWLLPVIAYKWQSQRLPRAGRLNQAWWGFAPFFFFSDLYSHSVHRL